MISGARFTRQGLDRFMADVRPRRLDVVVGFKPDRSDEACRTWRDPWRNWPRTAI